jgi:hypothetical protein
MREKYQLQILIRNQKEKNKTFMCSLMNINHAACTKSHTHGPTRTTHCTSVTHIHRHMGPSQMDPNRHAANPLLGLGGRQNRDPPAKSTPTAK